MWLKSVFALPMSDTEREIFRRYTGRSEPPAIEPAEIFTIVGWCGGKSFISALTTVFLACFRNYKEFLNGGERAVVLVLARDRDQAKTVFDYVKGILSSIPPLYQLVVNARAEWLGEFREDLETAFSLEAIEACVIRGRDELSPSPSISYVAFADPSGGRKGDFTLAIA
jgi:hypothetical protein